VCVLRSPTGGAAYGTCRQDYTVTVLYELTLRGDLGGPETIRLVRRIFRQAAREFWVLAPTGWSADLLEDTLSEFLSRKLPDLTDAVVAVSATEAAVVKTMRRIMKNWLIDQARKTDLGAIRMRLEKRLFADEGVGLGASVRG